MAYTWRRGRCALARVLLLAAAAAVLAVIAYTQSASAAHHRHRHGAKRAAPPRGLITGSYAAAAGRLGYELYVPATYKPGRALPLVVALHGCTQTADQFRQLTRFDALAAAKGFIVAFPEQSASNNVFRCWNWFQDQDTHRGTAEPALIAGITSRIRRRYTIDARRIYVAGFSAGAAMAEVMAATYPDIYAAAGVGSGCEYHAGAPCAGFRSADPEQAGRAAYQAMGRRARMVPFIAFQGDQDTIVPPVNAQQLVRAGQVTADWADDGSENGSVPSAPTRSALAQTRAGQSYTTSDYTDGHGHELAQLWVVHGMSHAWSGGNPAQQWSYPAGPDETAAIYGFFTTHPAAKAATSPGRH